jgi:triosephosphate isomerase
MERRLVIAGNWKMHKTPIETETFIARFVPLVQGISGPEILLIPPYTSLDRAGRLLGESGIGLGAQDLHFESEGAFTGAISAGMLRACGCRRVLVGHSERRHVFGDDDAVVRRKLDVALSGGLDPILCIGETLEERRGGRTDRVVARQLDAGLDGLPAEALDRIVIAYEPVWAIGTGETATPAQAQEAAASIRRRVRDRHGAAADSLRILYGGSVKSENAAALLALDDVDGVLVGGASLDPDAFAAIARAGSEA